MNIVKFEKTVGDIYLLRIPFSAVWTGVILIAGEKKFLIDSGCEPADKYIIPALSDLGLKISDIDYLLNTHSHGDHISAHYELVNKYHLKVAAFTKTAETLEDPAANAVRIRTRFPDYSPPPQSWLKGVSTDIVMDDGDILETRLQVIHTPGHDADCVCWYDIPTKTLITGDSIQANGTPTQGVGFYQDLTAYRKSLSRIKNMDIENMICGHDYDGIGYTVYGKENVKKAIGYCENRIDVYQKEIEKYVSAGILTDSEIAVKLIENLGCGMPQQLFLALYTVNEHLKNINNGG